MQVRAAIVAMAVSLSPAGPVAAQDAPPDITGVWTGTFTGGVRTGGGQLAPANPEPQVAHPGDGEFTLTIADQDGRGFTGTWGSELGTEQMQGVIRLDNITLLIVDEDSSQVATLLSDSEMEFCNHSLTAEDRFTMCFLLKRQ